VRPRLIRSRAWLAVALLGAATILATLSIAPPLWFRLLPHLQPHVTLWYLGVGALLAAALAFWAASAPVRRRRAVLAVGAVLAGYAALLFGYYRGEPPAKKFHLLEYGALAMAAFQAVRVESRDRRGLFVAMAFLVVIGTADETIQPFIPMRTFRWLDIFGNYLGAALGALAWTAASPHSPWREE